MADNALTSVGDNIRTVDRSGSGPETQVVIVDTLGTGSSERLGLGDTLILTGTSAGLTTATTAYTAGDQLGTEITISNATRTSGGLVIVSAAVISAMATLGAVDIFLFNAATTPAADNAANAWSDADMAKGQGVIHCNDVVTSANNVVAQATNLPVVYKPASGTSLILDLVTRTGHTFFGATSDLTVVLGVQRD